MTGVGVDGFEVGEEVLEVFFEVEELVVGVGVGFGVGEGVGEGASVGVGSGDGVAEDKVNIQGLLQSLQLPLLSLALILQYQVPSVKTGL